MALCLTTSWRRALCPALCLPPCPRSRAPWARRPLPSTNPLCWSRQPRLMVASVGLPLRFASRCQASAALLPPCRHAFAHVVPKLLFFCVSCELARPVISHQVGRTGGRSERSRQQQHICGHRFRVHQSGVGRRAGCPAPAAVRRPQCAGVHQAGTWAGPGLLSCAPAHVALSDSAFLCPMQGALSDLRWAVSFYFLLHTFAPISIKPGCVVR